MAAPTYVANLAGARRFLVPVGATRLAAALEIVHAAEAVTAAAVVLAEAPAADADVVRLEAPPEPRCLPWFRFSVPAGLGGVSPLLSFERRGDEVFLCATLEEARDRRPRQGATEIEPLAEVEIQQVTLVTAGGRRQRFTIAPPDPPPAADLPADQRPVLQLRIEAALYTAADGLAPADQLTVDQAMDALQHDGSRLEVLLAFAWQVRVSRPPSADPPDDPVVPPRRPPRWPRLPDRVLGHVTPGPAEAPDEPATLPARLDLVPLAADRTALLARAVVARRWLDLRGRPPIRVLPPPPQPEVPLGPIHTATRTRELAAYFPADNPTYAPIYAQITGSFADREGWRRAEHGWWKPAGGDQAYVVADEYRLALDARTGLPAIDAVLMPAAEPAGTYRSRVTLRVAPHFDPVRLDALRDELRLASHGAIARATLIPGGYAKARFAADDSRALLVDVFTGASATDALVINPEEGFSLAFEGSVEFIQLLYERLAGDGLRDWVELDLEEPGGEVKQHRLPVRLAMTALAALPLPTTVHPATDAAPWSLTIANPTPRPAVIGGVQARALQRNLSTDRVAATWPATWDHATFPLVLAAGAEQAVELRAAADDPELVDGWELALVDARPDLPLEVMLASVFTAGTSVRGWRIDVVCVPLKYHDRLSEADRAALAPVLMVELELRRKGEAAAEKLTLSREAPEGQAVLGRTVADFIRRDLVVEFEHRYRTIAARELGAWSEWQTGTGNSLSFVI